MIGRRVSSTGFSIFLASTPGGNLAESSVVAYDREAQSFLRDIDHRRKRFTRPYVESWLASRPMSPSTAMRALAAVKKLADYLSLPDPTIGVRRPRSSKNLPRPVEGLPFLLRRLQSDGAHVLAAVVQFLASTGLRVSEACHENGCGFEVVEDGQALRVKGKGGKERVVPISPETHRLIFDGLGLTVPGCRSSIPYTVKALQAALRPYGVTPHMLRHSFGTDTYARCGDLFVVAKLMGHSSVSTTEGYARMDSKRLRAAMGGEE